MSDLKWFQHGDVTIKPIDQSKIEGLKLNPHEPVLAEGEVTGHAHRVFGEDVQVKTCKNENGNLARYLFAPKGAEVRHEEHKPIVVPPGTYEIGIVQEYDHWMEESREVRD